MNAAANFAFANRSALAHRLREVLRLEMGVDGEARTLYDVAHNIAKIKPILFMVKTASAQFIEKAQPEPLQETVGMCKIISEGLANQF